MKKLFQIGSALNYGAPGKIAEQIGILAQHNGWDVYMAHGNKYQNKSALKTVQTVSSFQEHLHEIKSVLFDASGLGSTRETIRLVELLKEVQPDVIHLHNIHGYFLDYRVLFDYLRYSNIPIIWTLHDFWPVTGHCAHFINVPCYKWKTGCSNCPQPKSYPLSLVDESKRNWKLKKQYFSALPNITLVPVSHWVGSLVKDSFLGGYPINVIYNGVDTTIFKPYETKLSAQYDLHGKFVLIGVASPWSERKGYKDYLELRKQLSDDFAIIMVGLTDSQIKTLPKGIIGVEKTRDQISLAQYYSMADVVLNLSYQETFGMTTVEGMSCGTPSIVYNITASPELLDQETGMVVEPGDIMGVVTAIYAMRSKRKSFYSDACRRRVQELFDKDKCFLEYIRLYEKVAEQQ